MAVNPVTTYTVTGKDWSGESTSFSCNIGELAGDDFEGAFGGTPTEPFLSINSALVLLSNMNVSSRTITHRKRVSNAFATSAASRREKKWLIQYEDQVTFRLYDLEIPCGVVDNGAWFKEHTDEADLTVSPWSNGNTAVAYLQAGVKSPDGNDITIISATAVGRNL